MKRIPGLIALALCTTLSSPLAGAESASNSTIYRWVDESGQLHFGNPEEPPPGAEEVAVEAGTVIQPPAEMAVRSPPPHRGAQAHPRDRPARLAGERLKTRDKCEDYQEKLARVRSRMRAGYKASQYDKLMEQQRRYKKKVLELC